MEARGFREDYEAYTKAGIVILGVSPDDAKSHLKFKQKFDLPFTLLADTDKVICLLYETWGLKKFMGKEYEGVFRTTYLIDGQGKIAHVFEKVKPEGHSPDVLAMAASLGL